LEKKIRGETLRDREADKGLKCAGKRGTKRGGLFGINNERNKVGSGGRGKLGKDHLPGDGFGRRERADRIKENCLKKGESRRRGKGSKESDF